MRAYELTLILDPGLTSEKQKTLLETVSKQISAGQGKVTKTHELGKKELAYPIKKKQQGFFWRLELELTENTVSALDKKLKVDNNIIRYLFVK